MKKTGSVFITLILILTVFGTVVTSCDLLPENNDKDAKNEPEPGKLTVTLTNAAAANGHDLWAYVYAEGETNTDSPSMVIATNYDTIASGTASFILKEDDGNWSPAVTEWSGEAGESYDVYIYTDTGGDNNPIGDADARQTVPIPMVITIDGDQTIDIDYSDMVEYTLGE